VRQLAWRALYEVLAARVQKPEWAFMNYGYAAPSDAEGPALSPADEPDRLCIQLYDHVLDGTDLHDADVLEVGCGRGGGSSFIARYRGPRTTTGLDLARRSIALCRRHRRAPGLRFVQGDALSMPFADRSFDAVVNVESSHCYDSMDDFLAEVHRVLRPGGSFLFADLRPADEMVALRKRLGEGPLELVVVTDITERVRAALERDDDRRRSLMQAWIPRAFHRAFAPFAGFRGTATYAGFESGQMQYVSARLVRTASA